MGHFWILIYYHPPILSWPMNLFKITKDSLLKGSTLSKLKALLIIQSITNSLTHSLINSLTYSLTHILVHSLTYSLTHSLIHSLTYSLTNSLTQLIYYQIHFIPFTMSLPQSCVRLSAYISRCHQFQLCQRALT